MDTGTPVRLATRFDPRRRTLAADLDDAQRDRSVTELHSCVDGEIVEQRGVVDLDATVVARAVAADELHDRSGPEEDPTVGKGTGADLRPGEVGEHSDGPASVGRHRSDASEYRQVLVERAVAQVQPHHVRAGVDQLSERLGGVTRRSDGGHDLRSPGHICLSISEWNC